MLYLGICDDEKKHREKIHEMFSRALFAYDEIEVAYFQSVEEVMQAIEHNQFQIDLLLLDIHMPNKSGLNLAEYIRRNRIDVDIIFITISSRYMALAAGTLRVSGTEA